MQNISFASCDVFYSSFEGFYFFRQDVELRLIICLMEIFYFLVLKQLQ